MFMLANLKRFICFKQPASKVFLSCSLDIYLRLMEPVTNSDHPPYMESSAMSTM